MHHVLQPVFLAHPAIRHIARQLVTTTRKGRRNICLDLRNLFPGDKAARVTITKIVCSANHEICTSLLCQILFHIETTCKSDQDIEKHHRKRKRDHYKNSFPFIAPQVSKSHLMYFCSTGGAFFLFAFNSFRILCCFYRRNF